MYSFDLNTPFNLRIDEILPDEFVYFKLPVHAETALHSSIEEMTTALTKQSSRVFLAASHFEKEFLSTLAESVAWIGIEINYFAETHALFGNKAIPQLSGLTSVRDLAEKITALFQTYDLPFLFLDVEGAPDSTRIAYYKDVFHLLRQQKLEKKIYFNFNNPDLEEWNLKTRNTFSGMTTVHLDLSNKCTHSCIFCGLWGPDFIEEMKVQSKGVPSPEYVDLMNRQMPYARTEEILNSLPETVQKVQFGGAGDPLTHPQWFEIISRWRRRGYIVEVLTNFEYPSFEEIEKLHSLARGRRSFSFLINVSAATAETYKVIRPRQNETVFQKVLANIKHAHELRKRDGFGLSLTIVNIINSQNYEEAVTMVEFAHELGVGLWLKPVEMHSDIHKKYAIPEIEKENYKSILQAAAARARELNVELSLEEMLTDHINESDLYKTIPCTVGYTYARFEVDGTARPCCITTHSMGNVFASKPSTVWHGEEWTQWRENYFSIDTKKIKYNFCKMCPHIPLNQHAAKLLAKVRN